MAAWKAAPRRWANASELHSQFAALCSGQQFARTRQRFLLSVLARIRHNPGQIRAGRDIVRGAVELLAQPIGGQVNLPTVHVYFALGIVLRLHAFAAEAAPRSTGAPT